MSKGITGEAILGVYLAGGNSRRIRTALKPLLGSEHLSRSAVSRVVGHRGSRWTHDGRWCWQEHARAHSGCKKGKNRYQ